jgi:hypothetical protein
MYIIADPSWGTTNEFEHLFEPMLQIEIFNLGDNYIKASLQDNGSLVLLHNDIYDITRPAFQDLPEPLGVRPYRGEVSDKSDRDVARQTELQEDDQSGLMRKMFVR